jgi:hypothetical protein
MPQYDSDLIDLGATLIRTTERAILVRDSEGAEAWLPLSQVEVVGAMTPGKVIVVTAPQWLVDDKELEV